MLQQILSPTMKLGQEVINLQIRVEYHNRLIEMIGDMLDANHNPVEGQQYLVSYAYYDGSNGVTTIRLVKQGGTWSEYEG